MPPDAVRVVDEPEQIAMPDPPLIVGIELTVTVTVAVPLQPAVVPITV